METLKRFEKVLLLAVIWFMVLAVFMVQESHAEITPYDGDPVFDAVESRGSADNAWSRLLRFTADGKIEASTDSSVFKFEEDEGNPGYFYITPLKAGDGNLVLKDTSDNTTYTQTITVKPGYFQNMLDNSIFIGFGYTEDDGYDIYFDVSDKVGYGITKLPVCYPYSAGATARLYVDDVETDPDSETYFATWWGNSGDARAFDYDFAVRLGTEVRMHVEWQGASKDYTGEVSSISSIKPKKIKKYSKSGTAALFEVHKGDYLKIKVGKKTVKTVKFKKYLWKKTVKWINKKRMKKGTKVSYILYNKYKQKLASAKKTVGK